MRFSIYNKLFRSLCSSAQSKIIAFGFAAAAIFAIAADARAASPGALDVTYGSRGLASFSILNSTNYFSNSIIVQPDGKSITIGRVRTCVGATCTEDFFVARRNADGTPDNSFGTNGVVVTDYFGQAEEANGIALQSDGKIIVVGGAPGSTASSTNIQGFKVVRYLPNGTLDTAFGTSGRVYESFDDIGGIARSVAVQPDGKIVVVGTNLSSMLFIARFNPDGSLDTTFSSDGKFTGGLTSYEAKVLIQPDGKIIVVTGGGYLPPNTSALTTVLRFNADGTFDTTFGNGGATTLTVTDSFRPTVALQTDGKILISGIYNYGVEQPVPPLARLNQNGSIDAGFAPNHGEIVNNVCFSCTRYAAKVITLPDGRFYLVGYTYGSNTSLTPRFLSVSRYLPNGSIDTSFGFRGASWFKISNESNYIYQVNDAAIQPDGKIVFTVTADRYLPPNNIRQLFIGVVRVNTTLTPPSMRGDFDGDRKTDFAVFRPSNRFWYVLNSSNGSTSAERYGADGDVLTPGDYNYDLKTDLSVYRPSQSVWYLSTTQPVGGGPFGQTGDINVPEDYDGDGYTDIAVYRPSNGTWNIRYSSRSLGDGFYEVSFPFGASTDRPVPADYDGDGRADLAVFRPSNGTWYVFRSSDNQVTSTVFGISTDKTVQGDYDGDGKADIAVFRDGNWYILRSSDNGFVGVTWGFGTDKPVPGDYDGDGKFDVAVFRPSDGAWYALKSSDSAVIGQQWGIAEDVPIPFVFVK